MTVRRRLSCLICEVKLATDFPSALDGFFIHRVMSNIVDIWAHGYLCIVSLTPGLVRFILKSRLQVEGLGSQKALDGSKDRFQSQHGGPLLVGFSLPRAVYMINNCTDSYFSVQNDDKALTLRSIYSGRMLDVVSQHHHIVGERTHRQTFPPA